MKAQRESTEIDLLFL